MNQIFLSALPVIQKIEEAGFEAYFVGGAVRDYLLGKKIHDVDIASSATPQEIKSIFSATVDVGIEHGTILVIYKGEGYEITTFRAEGEYEDFRRPQSVMFIRSLVEDLKRRDFTMNAIAMDSNGKMIDPFNGKQALKLKKIETVGNPEDRFQEDALRLMRAIRFVSQLGFSLEKKTKVALAENAPLLQRIAIERVSEEMSKLLNGQFKSTALQLAMETRLYQYWPSIINEVSVLESATALNIHSLTEIEMWTLFLHSATITKPADHLKKWKLSNRKMKDISRLLSFLYWRLENNWTNEKLYHAGLDVAISVEVLFNIINNTSDSHIENQIRKQYENLPIKKRSELHVTGHNLLQWINERPGPWVNDVLTHIENAILNQQLINDRNEIRRWVKNWHSQLENN